MGKGSRTKLRGIVKAMKRKKGVREQNGRVSRTAPSIEPREDQTAIVLVARMKHHGLTEGQARDQKAATEHGRMFLRGLISITGHDLAERYGRLRRAWLAITGAPDLASPVILTGEPAWHPSRAVPTPDDVARSEALETPEEREARIRMAWERVQAAFAFRDPMMAALNDVVVRSHELPPSRIPQFIGALHVLAQLDGLTVGASLEHVRSVQSDVRPEQGASTGEPHRIAAE